MKNFTLSLAAVLCLGLLSAFVGCGDDKNKDETSFIVSTSAITFSYGDNSAKSFNITAENVSWTVGVNSDSSEWLSVDKTTGSASAAISVSVTEYSGDTDRVGTITVTPSNNYIGVEITVTQQGKNSEPVIDGISFSPSSLEFNASGNSSKTIAVTSDEDVIWQASVTSAYSSWLSISTSKENGEVTVSVTDNTSTSEKTGIIIFHTNLDENPQIEYRVVQAGVSVLSADRTSVIFEADENDDVVINITAANTEWTATQDSGSTGWLTVSADEDNNTITLSATDNTLATEKAGTITLSGTNGVSDVVINVSQKGITDISLSRTEITFVGEDNEDSTVTIRTEGTFSISIPSEIDWLNASISGNTITVSTDDYLMRGDARTAVISVTDDAGMLETAYVNVTQNSANYDMIFDQYASNAYDAIAGTAATLASYIIRIGSGDLVYLSGSNYLYMHPSTTLNARLFSVTIYTDEVFGAEQILGKNIPAGVYTNTEVGSDVVVENGKWMSGRIITSGAGVSSLQGNILYQKENGTSKDNLVARMGSITVSYDENDKIKMVIDVVLMDVNENTYDFKALYKAE